MKKLVIVLACMLVCLTLFAGCTGQKKGSNSGLRNSVEIDITDGENNTEGTTGKDTSSDDFTYSFKNPEDSEGIVVTPKE